jgi:fumarate hydratase class II
MMPLIAYDLLDSMELLSAGVENFLVRCVDGLEADAGRGLDFAEQSLGNATALVPKLGYEKAAAIAQEAYRSGRSIREVAKDFASRQGGLPEEDLTRLLDPRAQAGAAPHAEIHTSDEKIDLMSEESFPASDPPAY